MSLSSNSGTSSSFLFLRLIAAVLYWAIYTFEKSRRPEVEEVLVLPTA